MHKIVIVILFLLSSFSSPTCALCGSFPCLLDITIDEIYSGLRNGAFTSVQLTTAYIARIKEVASLNAVTEINPDALTIAASLDAELQSPTQGARSVLHGIPILLKDNIATNDKMNNTAGSYALLGARVPHDSTVVSKLRAAGVVILGKVSLTQWAQFRSSNSTNGWSSISLQGEAAYYPKLDPRGSSSGSGIASSLGLALATLGTETNGSIVLPSQRNNLVGIKPTLGLTSRYLVVPLSIHQDTVGPIARTVKDAAYILTAIAGKDPYDNYTSAIPFDIIPEYWRDLSPTSLKGAKLGIPRNAMFSTATNKPVLDAFEEAVNKIATLGASIYDKTNFPAYAELVRSNTSFTVLLLDFKTNIADYFASLSYNPNDLHSLSDLMNFTKNDPREGYPDRDISVWERAEKLSPLGNKSPEFWEAYQANLYYGGKGGILGALESAGGEGGLDALILPTDFANGIASIVGYPVVSVPLGFYPEGTPVEINSRGTLTTLAPHMPFGLSFLGRPFSEQKLIQYAYAFEQATKVRQNGPKQYVVPTVELSDVIPASASSGAAKVSAGYSSLLLWFKSYLSVY